MDKENTKNYFLQKIKTTQSEEQRNLYIKSYEGIYGTFNEDELTDIVLSEQDQMHKIVSELIYIVLKNGALDTPEKIKNKETEISDWLLTNVNYLREVEILKDYFERSLFVTQDMLSNIKNLMSANIGIDPKFIEQIKKLTLLQEETVNRIKDI